MAIPDVTGLFCRACGTLGVITKASLRISPINESNRIILTGFDDYKSAVEFVRDTTNNNIPEHSIIWNWQFLRCYDISVPTSIGKPQSPPELADDPKQPPPGLPYNVVTTLISGYEEIMQAAERVCAKVALKYGGRIIPMEELKEKSPGAVQAWKEFYLDYHQPKMAHNKKYGLGNSPMWILQARPENIADVEKLAVEGMAKTGVRPVCYYSHPFDFGRSMFFRIFTFVDPDDRELKGKIADSYKELIDTAMKRYGVIPALPKYPIGQLGGYYELLKRIKKAIDPNNILNPNTRFFTEDKK